MSRLPRRQSPDVASLPQSSIPSVSAIPSSSIMTLKRKHDDTDEVNDADHPRKLSNSNNGRPLRTNKDATNVATTTVAAKPPSRGVPAPAPLTKPRVPSFSNRTTTRPPTTRAASLPPRSGPSTAPTRPTTTRPNASRGPTTRSANNRPGARTASGGFAPALPNVNEETFQALQERMLSTVQAQMDSRDGRIAADMDAERAKIAELQANHLALSKDLAASKSAEITRRKELDTRNDELEALKKKHERDMMEVEMDMRRKDREVRELREDIRHKDDDLQAERDRITALKATVSEMSTSHLVAESQRAALQAQLSALQSMRDADQNTAHGMRLALETAQRRIAELEDEARTAERLRRKLHNQIQELKGNIRVFCRVRPMLNSDVANGASKEDERAQIEYPDKVEHKEIVLQGQSENAMGQARTESWNFTFDRVFEPDSTQLDVFEEVSQLAQSVTDGYNVCIFAYGQTGSGKSFTMEGGVTEATQGMIPRAVDQVFRVAEDLKPRGWEYKMEGQFLEIYNETINDLLGAGEFDRKKHEIKHDAKSGTRVTDTVVTSLSSPAQVRALLARAASRRTVAATLMNERSSRSHSVFILRVTGANPLTGETCEGSLNLVDLAGSERLDRSGAAGDKDRLRETQNINKSLSALGDVIAALGEKGQQNDTKGQVEKHIPYRNSKLTYLLQNSLSGNSKTLMILNMSPLASSLGESLCSLRFATKVNNTTIGTAKRQLKKEAVSS